MPNLYSLDSRSERSFLFAFADITRFQATARRNADDAVADVIDQLYERIHQAVIESGGRVLKYLGDAALILYPERLADAAVDGLLRLKEETDDWLASIGWDSRLVVKAHFGTAIAGPFGGRGAKSFDVIGKDVNTTVMLETRSFALSAQAFRKLSPELRRRFKKHTPPITYIPAADRH